MAKNPLKMQKIGHIYLSSQFSGSTHYILAYSFGRGSYVTHTSSKSQTEIWYACPYLGIRFFAMFGPIRLILFVGAQKNQGYETNFSF